MLRFFEILNILEFRDLFFLIDFLKKIEILGVKNPKF